MTTLPVVRPGSGDCWNHIGFRGDRSCPELAAVVHCHNCPVFAAAGREFLDKPSPDAYRAEWTKRLAPLIEEEAADLLGVLIFHLAGEWLSLPVTSLVEVTELRPVHRVPHRGGILAGLVNIRGELQLCVHLDQLLGIDQQRDPAAAAPEENGDRRMLVVRPAAVSRADGPAREVADGWVFPVDGADQVYRLPLHEMTPVPATVRRCFAHLTRGVFRHNGRLVGLLNEERLFQTLRVRIQAPGGASR